MKAKEARAIFPWWAWAGILVFRWVARLLPFLRYRPPGKNDLIFGVEERVLREIPS